MEFLGWGFLKFVKSNFHGYGSNQGLVKATEEKLGVSITDFVLEYINANRKTPWMRDCLQNPALCKGGFQYWFPRKNKADLETQPLSLASLFFCRYALT